MTSVTKNDPDKPAQGRNGDSNGLLAALGGRVRALRERRGITRKALSAAAGVSERHLANLEYGEGNVSVLLLDQIAAALQCSPAELIGDVTTRNPEWLMIRALLAERDEATLRKIRIAIDRMLTRDHAADDADLRIALIGLRGAGKSTLGAMLAQELDCPFIELSREIEGLAGCSIGEIQALYGMAAYARHERRALEAVIAAHQRAVIAVPGGLVSDPEAFNLLLSNCNTVWLQADPEDHMQRVIAQGDFRPMQGNNEAMQDLQGILQARRAFYAKARHRLDTSNQDLAQTFDLLCRLVQAGGRQNHSSQSSPSTIEERLS